MDTFDTMYPGVEHRFCIRHLHANCKQKGWKGRAFKDELFGAARATTELDFKRHLNVIKGMSQEAFDYLEKIDPRGWSRHAFGTNSKTDMIFNNIAESFNSWIKDARDKPLLTMLEMIRRQLMNRYHIKREGASQTTNRICPKILKRLERSKDLQRNHICQWRDGAAFEVDSCYGSRRVVNLIAMTCSCGRWQLNGIPCPHACAAIFTDRRNPEDFVHACYWYDTYKKAYAPSIHPMPGPDEWPKVTVDTILPPLVRAQPGRPKKARRKETDEPEHPYKVTRQGYDVRCGNCGLIGHNVRSCHEPLRPNRQINRKKPSKKKRTVRTSHLYMLVLAT
jgi:hypothetical protein